MPLFNDRQRRQPKEAPQPTQPPINLGMFGLQDAALSGWYTDGELFRGMPIGPDDVVVDVGCGEGGNLIFCASQGAEVIGVDIDAETLAKAEVAVAAVNPKGMRFAVAPAETVPVADGTATRVICTEVLEHVADPIVVMRELYRIGAPGAIYLIAVPDELQEHMQEHVAVDSYFAAPNHIRIVSRDELPQWAQAAGLEVISQSGYGFFWSIWWAMLWGSGLEEGLDRPWLVNIDEVDHPAMLHWTQAWAELIKTPEGRRIKEGLDTFMPKSQVLIARKPA